MDRLIFSFFLKLGLILLTSLPIKPGGDIGFSEVIPPAFQILIELIDNLFKASATAPAGSLPHSLFYSLISRIIG